MQQKKCLCEIYIVFSLNQFFCKTVYMHVKNVCNESVIFICTINIGPKRKKKQCYVNETNVELHVHAYFIYKIIKRKLQVYAISGLCIKNCIKAKTIVCIIRLEKKKCKQSLSRNMNKITHQKI